MKTAAFMTASYAGDFDRCRLLCESMDRFVTGHSGHTILVEDADVAQFRALEGPGRTIVSERDLLPDWLHTAGPSPLTRNRRLWWSTRTWPMRGWHVQQLRRIAFAAQAEADALVSCDSDMVFVRPYDVGTLWRGDDLRLYRLPEGIDTALHETGEKHWQWMINAAALFGTLKATLPTDDYIQTLVSWSSAQTAAMCAAIEDRSGRSWVEAIGRNRTFSECQIYGTWIDQVQGGAGHWHDPRALCRTYWNGDAMGSDELHAFVAGLAPYQVAVGLQSFTGTDGDLIRPAIGL